MKVLVIFGSKSDANIFEPLKSRLLAESHEVDFRMISVHRSPELLDKELATIRVNAAIAGAGLAAHLPGILSSKLLTPVFGIPCTAAIGGVDAYFAMAQMPFGFPVQTTAPDAYNSAVDAVSRMEKLDLKFSFQGFNLVIERAKRNLPHFQVQLERAKKLAERANVELAILDRPLENAVNICLTEINEADPECPLSIGPVPKGSDELRILVPILTEAAYRNPFASVAVIRRVQSVPGGIWTGINNVGNALLAALQMANVDGAYSAFLTNAKKGYIHA